MRIRRQPVCYLSGFTTQIIVEASPEDYAACVRWCYQRFGHAVFDHACFRRYHSVSGSLFFRRNIDLTLFMLRWAGA